MPSILRLNPTARPEASRLPSHGRAASEAAPAATAVGTLVTALGSSMVATAAFGRHHEAELLPASILLALGTVSTVGGQIAAPRDARVQSAVLLGWLVVQAGVLVTQLGDSHYDARTDHITRSHPIFIGGIALATVGLAAMLPALARQTPDGCASDLAAIGVALAVGGAAVTAFGAGSAANVGWARGAGLAAIALGLGLTYVGLTRGPRQGASEAGSEAALTV